MGTQCQEAALEPCSHLAPAVRARIPQSHTQQLPIGLCILLPRFIPYIGVLHSYSGMLPPAGVTVTSPGSPSPVPRSNAELGEPTHLQSDPKMSHVERKSSDLQEEEKVDG